MALFHSSDFRIPMLSAVDWRWVSYYDCIIIFTFLTSISTHYSIFSPAIPNSASAPGKFSINQGSVFRVPPSYVVLQVQSTSGRISITFVSGQLAEVPFLSAAPSGYLKQW